MVAGPSIILLYPSKLIRLTIYEKKLVRKDAPYKHLAGLITLLDRFILNITQRWYGLEQRWGIMASDLQTYCKGLRRHTESEIMKLILFGHLSVDSSMLSDS